MLIALDRFWALESQFLDGTLEAFAADQVKRAAIDCFPSAENFAAFANNDTLGQLAAVQSSDLTVACGPLIGDEVTTLVSLVHSLQQGGGPTAARVSKMGDFHQLVVARMEHFLQVAVPSSESDGQTMPSKIMTGRDAMQHLWAEFQEIPSDKRTLKDVAHFRAYAWMLGSEAITIVDKVVACGVREYRTNSMLGALADGKADAGYLRI